MSIRARLIVLGLAAAVPILCAMPTLCGAADLDRGYGPGPSPYDPRGWGRSDELVVDERIRRPARRVMGGPGYVGSEYGLGKPSYYGIGSRPDWGRSSAD